MKSRIFATISASIFFSPLASCQDKGDVQTTYQVVDEDGKPIEGALVDFKYLAKGNPLVSLTEGVEYGHVEKRTDKRGMAQVKATTTWGEFGAHITKEGFYRSGVGFEPEAGMDKPVNGRWQPWDATPKVVLRRIIKPIPLIARDFSDSGDRVKIPVKGKNVGFDLEQSDWVAPHGKGKVADLVFLVEDGAPVHNDKGHWDQTCTVSFSNPKDGLVLMDKLEPQTAFNQSCALRLPHHAPKDGYQPKLVKHHASFVDPPLTKEENKLAEERGLRLLTRRGKHKLIQADDTNPKANYYLRLRTKINDKGEIVSANYAKVHGDFEFMHDGLIRFTYYYNPIPNDTNLEFDPTRNLLASGYEPKPKPTFKPDDTEEDRAQEMRFWEEEEAGRKEKFLGKNGGDVKEP